MSGYCSLQFWKGFVAAGRPHTGLYAFLLALVSFKFFSWSEWHTGLFIAVIFGFITMSIMRFNDYIDARNDVRKNKLFAYQHKKILLAGWWCEAVLISAGLAHLASINQSSALFCCGVWFAGLGYSFVPHWYRVQNMIVALCSGSPALCAMFYFCTYEQKSVFTFLLFTALLWVSEVHKDVEDVNTDVGYKRTLPTQLGSRRSILLLIASLHLVAAIFFWHPVAWLQIVAVTLIPYLAYVQGLALLRRDRIEKCYRTMKATIASIGLVLFVC